MGKAINKLSISELSDQYIDAVVTFRKLRDEEGAPGSKQKRFVDKIKNIEAEIRERGEAGKTLSLRFINHEDPRIRLEACLLVKDFDRPLTVKTLKELSKLEDMTGFSAGKMLDWV